MQGQAQRNKYLETAVQTATPAQLLIMLCDGAVRFLKAGIEAIRNQQFEEANRQLCKVQDIVSEFVITLDLKSPIADNLVKIYDYLTFRLIEANTKKAVEPAEEVLKHLIDLKQTWVEAAKLSAAATAPTKAGATHG